MIDLEKNTIDLDLFKNVLREIKNSNRTDILDSFSDNQFKSKTQLLKMVNECDILDKDSQVSIFGSWYGSLLVPFLAHRVNKIIMLDLDDEVIRTGKNRFFSNYENVSWSTGDVFSKWRDDFVYTSLFINTSCEHMQPMKKWQHWNKVYKPCYFAFQSNNMYHINTHTNCVNSIQEFKAQMPKNFQILQEHELQEDRGIRFTLVGKINE